MADEGDKSVVAQLENARLPSHSKPNATDEPVDQCAPPRAGP